MRVLCTLPHCSSPINGVPFDPTPHGWVSADLSAAQAEAFTVIPGYTLYHGGAPGEAEESAHTAAPVAVERTPDPAPADAVPLNPAPARRTRPRTPR